MNSLRIALCDLRRILKDRMMIIWTILMPIGFVYLFGNLTASTQYKTWLPIFNHDPHELSRLFIDQLKADDFSIDVRAATDEIYVGGWSRALIIPATFSEELLDGKKTWFTLTKGSGDEERTLAVQTLLVKTLVKFTGALSAVDVAKNGWTNNNRERFLHKLAETPTVKVEQKSHASLRPPPSGFSFSLPAYLVMFTLINSIMLGGITLVSERQNKQLIRLLAAPASSMEIYLGKIVGKMVTPLLQALAILVLGYFLFDIPLGDHPIALIPVLLCFSACCGSLALLFGSICTTEQQISSFGLLITLSLSALGGCWWPLEMTPEFFKSIARLTPTFWALQGVHDVMSFGKSYAAIVPESLVLLLFATAFCALSLPFIRLNRT